MICPACKGRRYREETLEVEAELSNEPGAAPTKALSEEIGDLLFVVANLARHAKVDPEQALRAANTKFERRFHHIEARLAQKGSAPAGASRWSGARRATIRAGRTRSSRSCASS